MINFLSDNDRLWRKYALKISKDTNIADDLVQDMYIKLHQKQQLNKGYVYMTLLTLFYDYKKQVKPLFLDDLEYENQSETLIDFESEEYLKKELQKIPFEARECFIENQNLSYRKLADKYKLNYMYIRRLAEKAKEVLKENQILKDLYYG